MSHHVSTSGHDYLDDSPVVIVDDEVAAQLEAVVPGWGLHTPWAFLQRGQRDSSMFTVTRTVGVATPITLGPVTLPVTTMAAAKSAGAKLVLVGDPDGGAHWKIARLFSSK